MVKKKSRISSYLLSERKKNRFSKTRFWGTLDSFKINCYLFLFFILIVTFLSKIFFRFKFSKKKFIPISEEKTIMPKYIKVFFGIFRTWNSKKWMWISRSFHGLSHIWKKNILWKPWSQGLFFTDGCFSNDSKSISSQNLKKNLYLLIWKIVNISSNSF